MKLLVVLGLATLATGSCACRSHRVDSPPVTRMEVRLAANESQPGWETMKLPETGEAIYVSPEVTLSNEDIRSAEPVQGPNGESMVAIQFTPAGAEKFATFTSAHIGEPAAIWVDGQVMAVPVIRAQISDGRAMINGRFTEDEARELARSIVPKK
jgi:preprotein translocase subunit SecD